LEVYFFTISDHSAAYGKISQQRVGCAGASKPVKFSGSIPYSFDGKNDFRTGDFGRWNTRQDPSSNGLAKCLCNVLHLFLAEAWVDRQGEYLP
jgi:hypothetical protein